MTGTVLDIQRFCLHDGPGIRTTVFFKGCPLRCSWCHNPESFILSPQLAFEKAKCSGCGRCVAPCPQNVHRLEGDNHFVDFSRCKACGKCVDLCPGGALRIYGSLMDSGAVMDTVLRDRAFYRESGGGVTFSGGEPTLQYDFLVELLEECRREKIHTCVETCGYLSREKLDALLPLVDLWLFDYKVDDAAAHKQHTGMDNKLIKENLAFLLEKGASLVVRAPVIPGVNDTPDHIAALRALKSNPAVTKVEPMPYHSFGKAKWEALGLRYLHRETPDLEGFLLE